eukprot:GILK01008381.1.p1 GENE.GILK01008381.1~~GILK01008381.1.p1  ORF type:complete len:545 (-),score=93.42 GILK01008381.1:110-1744(-)
MEVEPSEKRIKISLELDERPRIKDVLADDALVFEKTLSSSEQFAENLKRIDFKPRKQNEETTVQGDVTRPWPTVVDSLNHARGEIEAIISLVDMFLNPSTKYIGARNISKPRVTPTQEKKDLAFRFISKQEHIRHALDILRKGRESIQQVQAEEELYFQGLWELRKKFRLHARSTELKKLPQKGEPILVDLSYKTAGSGFASSAPFGFDAAIQKKKDGGIKLEFHSSFKHLAESPKYIRLSIGAATNTMSILTEASNSNGMDVDSRSELVKGLELAHWKQLSDAQHTIFNLELFRTLQNEALSVLKSNSNPIGGKSSYQIEYVVEDEICFNLHISRKQIETVRIGFLSDGKEVLSSQVDSLSRIESSVNSQAQKLCDLALVAIKQMLCNRFRSRRVHMQEENGKTDKTEAVTKPEDMLLFQVIKILGCNLRKHAVHQVVSEFLASRRAFSRLSLKWEVCACTQETINFFIVDSLLDPATGKHVLLKGRVTGFAVFISGTSTSHYSKKRGLLAESVLDIFDIPRMIESQLIGDASGRSQLLSVSS